MTLIEYAKKIRPIIEKAVQNLDNDNALEAITLFPSWNSGVEYTAGTKVKYEGMLYSVLQDHTSQTDWKPDKAHSLFAKVLISDTDIIPDWEQPDSTNPYKKGDKVRFNEKIYKSIVDNNVWRPGVYGWEETE